MYLLRLLPVYRDSPLVRTRDPARLAECHTVVDVGGEYDPARNRFDHHQRSFSTTFPNHNTKLSSAGLVFMHFGRAIIAQHTSLPLDDPGVDLLYEKLYSDFIEALDANDNGISVYDPAAVSAAGLEKRFKDTGITLSSLVGDFNFADQNGGQQDEDALFEQASKFIGEVFLRKLRDASSSWLPARSKVGAAYEARKAVHPSGKIMVIEQSRVPWKEHLSNFEKEAGGGPEQQVYYVIYPESADENSKWRVQCVPVAEGSFESRKPLPERWRGERDENLDKILADESVQAGSPSVPSGAIFVHATGFIGGHQTREGALAMAVRSLEA